CTSWGTSAELESSGYDRLRVIPFGMAVASDTGLSIEFTIHDLTPRKAFAMRFRVILLFAAMVVLAPRVSQAATYYIGQLSGSTPLDDADCGTGRGAHPSGHPCASLAYWTQHRETSLSATNMILFAPGLYASPAGSTYNCIPPRANTTYRAADGAGNPV